MLLKKCTEEQSSIFNKVFCHGIHKAHVDFVDVGKVHMKTQNWDLSS